RTLVALCDSKQYISSFGKACRSFYAIIRDSDTIQYLVALDAGGMTNGPPGALALQDRLDNLKQFNEAWKHWYFVKTAANITADASMWLVHWSWKLLGGNALMKVGEQGDLSIERFPSRLRGIEGKVWTLPDVDIDSIAAVDATQDLLIEQLSILVDPPTCLSLSTGTVHPACTYSGVLDQRRLPGGVLWHQDYVWGSPVQVKGDVIAIYHHSEGKAPVIYAYHWKSGLLLWMISVPESPGFSIISDRDVVLFREPMEVQDPFRSEERPEILLYHIDPDDNGASLNRMSRPRVLHLRLPPLILSSLQSTIRLITSEPPTSVPVHPGHFYPARNDGILLFYMQLSLGYPKHDVILFVQSKLFLKLSNTVQGPADATGRVIVPWEAWGCDGGVRLQPAFDEMKPHAVKQELSISDSRMALWNGGSNEIVVLDFHPSRLQHTLRYETSGPQVKRRVVSAIEDERFVDIHGPGLPLRFVETRISLA
ncbi:hypothetical protein OF83DRAFT_1193268, partial [Amylostereum chailletii]